MARISEFEQSGTDNIEVAITATEWSLLSSGLAFRITTFDQNGNEAIDTINGGTLSFFLPTDPNDWVFEVDTGEYVYVQPVPGGSFSDNNHNVSYQGFTLSSINATGFDTVYDAYMVGGFGSAFDNSFASAVNSSTIIPPGTVFTNISQQTVTPGGGNNDATLKWDAPDIDTPVVTRGSDLGNTGTAPPPPCFVTGTLITCEDGDRLVETLKVGDRVLTERRGFQTIRWIGRRRFSGLDILADDRRRPIRIGAGALGNGLPRQDLLVSRQHRMVVASDAAKGLTGARRVLIAARHMTKLKRVSLVCPARGVTYHHILFDHHEVVFANGAATESLYLSATAESAKLLQGDDLLRIEELGLLDEAVPPALPIPADRDQKEIVRQLARRMPVVADADMQPMAEAV
ncbi:Hint domain-containing protein [Primorskyibacter sedentarius]|uniref:Hint domain-containing protein n=1 Tax=Primorskyibacter sedentarius TaxID=745311 RepID=UPI003EB869D9